MRGCLNLVKEEKKSHKTKLTKDSEISGHKGIVNGQVSQVFTSVTLEKEGNKFSPLTSE